jgi:hypothetical protein
MNHLTVEQCRKLREVGFPQKTLLWQMPCRNWEEGEDPANYPNIVYGLGTGNPGHQHMVSEEYPMLACPTLEELLEWLGYQFMRLFQNEEKRWEATYAVKMRGLETASGATPLEAVYNLAITIKA